jgi:hypothetical protein
MVHREWAEMRQLYKTCRPRPTSLLRHLHPWYIGLSIWGLPDFSVLQALLFFSVLERAAHGYFP